MFGGYVVYTDYPIQCMSQDVPISKRLWMEKGYKYALELEMLVKMCHSCYVSFVDYFRTRKNVIQFVPDLVWWLYHMEMLTLWPS